jgi:hypothetical protein
VMAPPPPRDLRPDVDAELAEIVVRCLAKVPEQRPRALEVAEVLAEPPAVESHLVRDVLPSVETSSTAVAGTPPAAVVSRSAPITWWSRLFEAFGIGGGRWALLVAGTFIAAALIILLLRIVS